MPTNMTMPRLSDTMEVGTIVKWHVKPGDKVKSGQVIADIETDKATMELQTFDDGTIGELSIAAGKSCPVGQTILKWQGGDDAPAASSAPATAAGAGTSTASAAGAARSTSSTSASAVAVAPAPTTHPAHSTDRVFASPLAR
jgi:pyruvate dehydrogenase E2 component (dihydrolipoamide acetyltransferase)